MKNCPLFSLQFPDPITKISGWQPYSMMMEIFFVEVRLYRIFIFWQPVKLRKKIKMHQTINYLKFVGHCLKSAAKNSEVLTVRLGVHSKSGKKFDEYKVVDKLAGPFHKHLVYYDDGDVALLVLDRKIKFAKFISPICLTGAGQDFVGSHAIIAGESFHQHKFFNFIMAIFQVGAK